MTKDRELLLYIDPGFLPELGHYRNFAINIHHVARNRRVELRHFVSKMVPEAVARKYGLERHFRFTAMLNETTYSTGGSVLGRVAPLRELYSGMKLLTRELRDGQISDYKRIIASNVKRILRSNSKVLRSFASELRTILDGVDRDRYDRVTLYMYTSHPLYFPIVAQAANAAKYAGVDIECYLGLFYLNLDFSRGATVPDYEGMLSSVSNALERCDRGNKIRIHSDSDRTIERFGGFFRRPVSLFPLPLDTHAGLASKSTPTPESEDITVGYFGYAGRKQGYLLVRALYDRISSSERYPHVRFIIRHVLGLSNETMLRIAASFRTETKCITHVDGALSNEDYRAWMSKCDVLVLPHRRDDYPCQTSGTFVDCLVQRKIVVVPENTWMADQLVTHGSGTTFESDNVEGFISAVEGVLDDFERFRGRTERNIDQFAKRHTAESLFDALHLE